MTRADWLNLLKKEKEKGHENPHLELALIDWERADKHLFRLLETMLQISWEIRNEQE